MSSLSLSLHFFYLPIHVYCGLMVIIRWTVKYFVITDMGFHRQKHLFLPEFKLIVHYYFSMMSELKKDHARDHRVFDAFRFISKLNALYLSKKKKKKKTDSSPAACCCFLFYISFSCLWVSLVIHILQKPASNVDKSHVWRKWSTMNII